MGIYDFKNIGDAPVRVTVYLPRKLYEEAEKAAKILRGANIVNLIVRLLEDLVEELKKEGYDLKPFWGAYDK